MNQTGTASHNRQNHSGEQFETTTPRWRKRAFGTVGIAILLIITVILGLHYANGSSSSTAVKQSGRTPTGSFLQPPQPGQRAPGGTFITPTGTRATIASLRGKPTMVWFVADSCAGCAASISAVAANLQRITGEGIQILTLGLYGAFPPGKAGIAQLLRFGRAHGGRMNVAGWRWGMASKALSMAYDPLHTPDEYLLIGADGHIRYRNDTPSFTMSQLLSAASNWQRKSHLG